MDAKRFFRNGLAGVVLAAALAASSVAPAAGRPGEIQFSNGETRAGTISLTPGSELRIHTGKELRTLAPDAVREIRIEPESEKMEQQWRFVEAGRVEKEKWGQPYPVRHLRATLILVSGERIAGRLYTTVLYVETPAGEGEVDPHGGAAEKVMLPAKQRGQEGETLADLVYPVRIAFADPGRNISGDVRIRVRDQAAVVALTRGALTRLVAGPAGREEQMLPSTLGAKVFLAEQADGAIRVGWPAATDAELRLRFEQLFSEVRDFFDRFDVLGALLEGENAYALVMASRAGRTTLHAEQSQPWRLEIWRWKLDDDQAMAAAKGYFFRGILARGESPPPVTLDPALWNLEIKDDMTLP